MKILLLIWLAFASSAHAKSKLWYRDAGEYISSRTTRMGVPTDVNAKIITDGKRFDASVGKRIPLYTWDESSFSDAWTVGIDGGMLASLERSSRNGKLTFATNTFDGFFGAFVARATDGWVLMFHTAHLSAHLVDSSPRILTPILYNQFWNEIIVGKSFPDPREESDWDLHFQGSVGMNNSSTPPDDQPRGSFGTSFGYAFGGADSIALLASADALRAGVMGQKPSYSFFLGLGSLNRPNTTHRPYRIGLSHFTGSDYRNQLYALKQDWTSFEITTEF